ncbi:MAG: type II toxin-antitoxin system ParD family antitoxin [Alphaproteobacteria bacterium]|nr:type II toxin-antitoxin system ParD family antitoxin [Alphaproteobacteria bacterium]
MAKNVSLGKYYDEFVEEKVRSGRYATASEVIRDGLRHLENQEQREAERLAILRAEIQKGLNDPVFIEGEAAFTELDAIIDDYDGNR